MSLIAIITARGGSKRIIKKNIKVFCGKPIIAYSIEAALDSGIFDEVMVSTDSEEIVDISKKYGAKVPFMRNAETSDDYATTYDVLKEVLENYENVGMNIDVVCCIYPTAPFVTGTRLKEAYDMMVASKASAALPVVQFSYPPLRGFVIDENGMVKYKWKEYEKSRSQDLEKLYHDVGQFYFIKKGVLLSEKTLIPENTIPIIVPEREVQDIDTLDDWEMAEFKYSFINNNLILDKLKS